MALWEVRTSTQMQDPRDSNEWGSCSVLAFTTRFIGRTVSLVEGNDEAMAQLRASAGIQYVDKAADTDYLDDRSGSKVRVLDGGTRTKRVPDGPA